MRDREDTETVSTETSTLDEAEELLREALAENSRMTEAARHLPDDTPHRVQLRAERMEIIQGLIVTEAIRKGVHLGCQMMEARITKEGP